MKDSLALEISHVDCEALIYFSLLWDKSFWYTEAMSNRGCHLVERTALSDSGPFYQDASSCDLEGAI